MKAQAPPHHRYRQSGKERGSLPSGRNPQNPSLSRPRPKRFRGLVTFAGLPWGVRRTAKALFPDSSRVNGYRTVCGKDANPLLPHPPETSRVRVLGATRVPFATHGRPEADCEVLSELTSPLSVTSYPYGKLAWPLSVGKKIQKPARRHSKLSQNPCRHGKKHKETHIYIYTVKKRSEKM